MGVFLLYYVCINRKETMLIKGDKQNDLRTYRFSSGYTMQETMLLMALRTQAKNGLLMTNPRVTGYTSFAKAVIGTFNLGDKTPKTCKTLYKYLKQKGYYDRTDTGTL